MKVILTSKLKMMCWGLIALFVVNIVVAFLQQLLLKAGLINPIPVNGMIPAYMSNMSKMRIWSEIVLLAPLFEELSFRGILQSGKFKFRAAIGMLAYLLVCKTLRLNFYELTIYTGLLSVVAFCCLLLPVNAPQKPSIRKVLLIASVVGFALWHYHNFDFNNANTPTIFVSLLPFLLNGLIFTYVSLKFGLQWSILLHLLNNAWPLLIWFR